MPDQNPIGIVLSVFLIVVGAYGRSPSECDDFHQVYIPLFHREGFDIVVGEVNSSRLGHGEEILYQVAVAGDMTGKVKAGSVIEVRGFLPHPISDFGQAIPEFDKGDTVVLPLSLGVKHNLWEYEGAAGQLPIGLDSGSKVAKADAPKVAAALKEVGAGLAAPDGRGPSRQKARDLLGENNYYLWALGAWRLARDAQIKDAEQIKGFFNQPDLTPAQALWLGKVLFDLTGPAEADVPETSASYALSQRFLQNYVKLHGRNLPTTQRSGKDAGDKATEAFEHGPSRSDKTSEVYPVVFYHDGFDVLVGEITSTAPGHGDELAYLVMVAGDMTGKVEAGSSIEVEGLGLHPDSGYPISIPGLNKGDIVVLPLSSDEKRNLWQYEGTVGRLPIGLDSGSKVAKADVSKVQAALEEVGAALAEPGRKGPSKQRVKELLHENNFYLWALGVWRLSRDAQKEDLERLKNFFDQPDLTPSQALWLDGVLYDISGPAAIDQPQIGVSYALLQAFLENYVKLHGRTMPTTQTGEKEARNDATTHPSGKVFDSQ